MKQLKGMSRTMKYQKIIINGIRLLFTVFSIFEIFKLEWANVGVLLAGLVLSFIPNLYTKWIQVNIPMGAYLFLTLFLFASQFLGSYLGAYTYFSWWDIMLHLLSGIMVGYVGLILLVTLDRNQMLFQKKKIGLIVTFIFMAGATGAVLWEMIEFTGDTFFGTNAQLGSLQDTMEDLICGTMVGGSFAIYVGLVLHKGWKSCVEHLLQVNGNRTKHKK